MPSTIYAKSEGARFATGKHVDLQVVECTCGILFAIPYNLYRSARAHRGTNGWQISCPLGHTWHYTGEDESPELEWERERATRLQAQLDQTEASLRTTKGHVTRLKKRAKAGVCPCCNRSFQQLARHMESKHPAFDPEAAAI